MADMLENTNTNRSMMTASFGESRWSKQRELSSGMSIHPNTPDSYTNANRNAFGGVN